MARETREDRIVRTMTPALTEALLELKGMSGSVTKEAEVETWCQSVIKLVLGFSASAGYLVRSQETKGNMRFDLTVYRADKPDVPLFIVEVKKLDSNLDRSDFRSGKTQLSEYMNQTGGTRWGVLTNGNEWRLYDFKSDGISVVSTDVRNDASEVDTTSKGVQEAAIDLLDFSASAFEDEAWEELSAEAQALSPDSLAKAVLSIDIVNRIRKTLNEEHGYRASVDSLTDKLSELIEQGLNDLGSSWNDTKKAELDRYIRNQKRQAKRARKRKATMQEEETVATDVSTGNGSGEAA